ncbi:Trp biosynthesis-associated membrane protein [Actinopolymorpha pittospori]
MTSRRQMFLTLALVLVGAALVLLAASRTWVTAALSIPDYPSVSVAVSGGDAAPLARAAGFVGLAGVLALVATRGIGRRIAGALVGLAGLASVVAVVLFWSRTGSVADDALRRAAAGVGGGTHATEVASTSWPVLALVGGVLVTVGGLLAAAGSHRWPSMGAKYDAPTTRRKSDADPWAALDRGEDPTTRD